MIACLVRYTLVLMITALFRPDTVAADHATLPIGAQAPDFKLVGVDGKTYTLASFSKAKLLAIVFTCNHCPTAQAYEDRLVQLKKDYTAKGVELIAISPNDPKAITLDELGYTDLSRLWTNSYSAHFYL